MAKWSGVWYIPGISKKGREDWIKHLRFTKPSKPKSKDGGKYPHEQRAK